MKKFSIITIALLLIVASVFTSCRGKETYDETKEGKTFLGRASFIMPVSDEDGSWTVEQFTKNDEDKWVPVEEGGELLEFSEGALEEATETFEATVAKKGWVRTVFTYSVGDEEQYQAIYNFKINVDNAIVYKNHKTKALADGVEVPEVAIPEISLDLID